MKDKIANIQKRIRPYIFPINGTGELMSLQNIITISADIFVICFLVSIIIDVVCKDCLDIIENYCIGIACSVIVVLFTTIIQYTKEHARLMKEFNNIVFPMVLVLYRITKADNEKHYDDMLDTIKAYIDDYTDFGNVLFWFNREKLEIYYNFCREMTNLFLIFYKDNKETEDIYSKIVEGGYSEKCLEYMSQLLEGNEVNQYKVFLEICKKEAEYDSAKINDDSAV